MNQDRKDLTECLRLFTQGAANGRLRAVFAVALADDGPLQVVLVEPDERESLIIAINEELTRMLGSPHHIVATNKLRDFLVEHNISDGDLLDFEASHAD